jgi:hypothetical protein
VCGE